MSSYNWSLTQRLTRKQEDFIKDSVATSFPKIKISFNQNNILLNNYNKKNLLSLKNALKRTIFVCRGIEDRKVIFRQNTKIKYKKDPLKILIKNREVVKISKKLFQFQGNFLNIFRTCNNYFYDIAIKKFNAIDQENPVLWPIDLYKKINYLAEFPQQSLLMAGLKQKFSNYNKFALKYSKKKNFPKLK